MFYKKNLQYFFAGPTNKKLISVSPFHFRLLYLVETGIVKYMLGENLTNAAICPLNLGTKERQLRNSDLAMTYWIMFAGYGVAGIILFTEVIV